MCGELTFLNQAPLARRHLPTIWWLYRVGVRRALCARCIAQTGSCYGWSERPEWALLCELQRPLQQGSSKQLERQLAPPASAPTPALVPAPTPSEGVYNTRRA